uniref:Protein kinase domain-containing protein n=1 Tax=Echeneis naucrates TaxID=173247 RepID=A0A665VYS1_ECHNA
PSQPPAETTCEGREVAALQKDVQQGTNFDLPLDGSEVTLSDIERCYDIGRVIGDGNFAMVRECCRRDNGQTFAIKIVERSKLIGREHMMQNELSLLGSLCHPRIVRLVAYHHTHTHSYLVMELVSGGDLFEAISERGKFPEADAGLMVSDMSEALNYIHCKSIVHRDLKPENLLVGIRVSEKGVGTKNVTVRLCYGVAVDVWALGVILYILLCGFPPFLSRDRDQEELFQLIKQGQINFLSPYWDPISEGEKYKIIKYVDPTVRLTAEQTLLHPWVKAMASNCRQRMLIDKTQRITSDYKVEAHQVQGPAQTGTAGIMADTKPSSEGEITVKEFNGTPEKHTEMNTSREKDEDEPPQHQSAQTETVHTVYTQIKVSTTSADTPGQNKLESGSPNREPNCKKIQDVGPELSKAADWELNQLDATKPQTQLPSQSKTKSKQNSQQRSPADSPPFNQYS